MSSVRRQATGRSTSSRRRVARVGLVGAACLTAASVIVGVGAADTPPALRPTTGGDASSLLGAVGAVEGTPCTATARACVELATHTAWLLREGQVVRGPVAFMDGDAANPTPRGTFVVEWKAEQWTSREYGVPMPYSVFFAPGGIAFHEGGLGTSSAGCVKLVRDDAVRFFDHLQVGDEVQVR